MSSEHPNVGSMKSKPYPICLPCLCVTPDDEALLTLGLSMGKLMARAQTNSFYAVISEAGWWLLDKHETLTSYEPDTVGKGGWIEFDLLWIIRLVDSRDPTVRIPDQILERIMTSDDLIVFPPVYCPSAN